VKLAIATNDKETIPRQHFGESRYFCIVDILNTQPFTVECRGNPIPEHHVPNKPERILELLQDCDALVGRGFGAGSFAQVARQKKQVLLTSHERIEDVTRDLHNGDLRRFKQFDPALNKFVAMEG